MFLESPFHDPSSTALTVVKGPDHSNSPFIGFCCELFVPDTPLQAPCPVASTTNVSEPQFWVHSHKTLNSPCIAFFG
jgi:hypothetical protein